MLIVTSTLPRHSGLSEEEFGTLHNSVKRGDMVGVKGFPGKSKRGELSVFPQSLLVLAPCLHMVPKHRLDNQVSIHPFNSTYAGPGGSQRNRTT